MLGQVARVLIADRAQATRAAIRAALEEAGHVVCADCEHAASAVAAAERTCPGVCLIDLDLPGGGISAVRAIASPGRSPRIIVLASRARDHDFFAALRAGATGFVIKDVDPRRLPQEVEAILADGAALSPSLTARLIEEFRAVGQREAGHVPARLPLLPGATGPKEEEEETCSVSEAEV